MKTHKPVKLVAVFLSVLMLFSVIPMTAYAAWQDDNVVYNGDTFGVNGYYNVISKKDYTLVPGAATETEMVLNNASGDRRQVMHIIECDPSNPDISIVPGYYGIDKDLTNPANHSDGKLTDTTKYYEDQLGYNVVGAMNTGLAYDCNAPYSYLVYNGQVLVDRNNNVNNFHSGYCKSILCVYKNPDDTCYCELRTAAQGLRGDEWQAIGANFSMIINNGQLVRTSQERTSFAARSLVGVKENGTLVLLMNDGRGANNSVGLSDWEEGEAMQALGCKWAFECDGGGSSTFVSKRVGEDSVSMRSTPCDGSERPTLNSVFIVSNVGPTGELDTVNVESDYDYFAPGTTYEFGASAIDTHGYAMDMPADAAWALSDNSFGTINNGTFVSNGTLGDVDVQVLSNGNVVGSRTIHVANPTTLTLQDASTVIPYSTAEKTRTLTFPIIAKVVEANVFYDNTTFNIASSNPNAGTIDGYTFTSTQDDSVSGTTVTLTYLPTNQNLTYTINLGKGSEVVWDFEDQDLHGFMSQDDAEQWQTENGQNPFSKLYSGGNISTCITETAFLASEANDGKVHNGNYSFGLTIDMTQVDFNEWTYANIYNVEGIKVLRDTANGINASTFGMWVRIPENFYQNGGGIAIRFDFMAGSTAANVARTNFNGQYKGKNINNLTEADIPENRWIYVTTNLTGYNYVRTEDPTNGLEGYSPDLARMYVKPDRAQTLTYYFDDFTIDYSSAIDDRVPPTISDPQYATADANVAFNEGTTITAPSAAFTAYVSDDSSGIDPATAAISIDGNEQTTQISGNMMYCNAVPLSVGTHKVKFEIADNLGNATTLTRTIVCQSTDTAAVNKTVITLEGRNDSGENPVPGSVYYIDVCCDNNEGFDSVFTLDLNTANEWILDQIVANKDFDVSYTVDKVNPNKVTFTCNTNVAFGEKTVMFTVPVKVYNPLLTNGSSDGGTVSVSGKSFIAPLSVKMTSCSINESYGNYDETAVADFEAKRQIVRHDHTAQAIADKAPTCTEMGYTGRTYCDECQSVVDWGTAVPATGHEYELVNGQFVCTKCEDVYQPGTGLFEMNGKTYYAINNNLMKGWQDVDGKWYYFDPETYAGVNGEIAQKSVGVNANYKYNFTDGKLESGLWANLAGKYRYYYGPDYYRRSWQEIDGATYYFGNDGYRLTGYQSVSPNLNARPPIYELYNFAADGKLIEKITSDGIYNADGTLYYINNGVLTHTGLIKIDDDYYYFDSMGKAAQDETRYIAADCIDASAAADGYGKGYYTFGADGKLVKQNGIIDGYYYENGVKTHKGLFVYDGDVYYANTEGLIVTNVTRYVAADCIDESAAALGYKKGNYEFGPDGKLVDKSGIIDGYYYEDGVRVHKGLFVYNGDVYYANTEGMIVTNVTRYVAADCIDESAAALGYTKGNYEFGADGKLVDKNGIVDGYYYEDGVRVHKGLFVYNGDVYYANTEGKIVTNVTRYVAADCIDASAAALGYKKGYYEFGADGKLANKNGIVDGYYYEDGVCVHKGLFVYNGDVYYANTEGKIVTNVNRYVAADCIDASAAALGYTKGYYTFGADGKMVQE